MDNFALRVKIIKANKEEIDVCLGNGEGNITINETPLKNPERLSHWLVHKALMLSFRTSYFEVIQPRP
jgi:hypothetical protein